MLNWMNANPGILILLCLVILLGAMVLLIGAMQKWERRQLNALRRDIRRENDRMTQSLGFVNEVLATSARQIGDVSGDIEERQERLRDTVEKQMAAMREENDKKLDKIRETVDERLKSTLEQRLGESFRLVSTQLENVYRGLGEMHTLAGSVGDLKRVLTNVKSRGVWGEVRLRALMEENLTLQQFAENVAVVPGSTERVEFAVILPGKSEETVYLPVDSKFPQEDYQRLLDAYEKGDAAQAEACGAALERAIREQAKRIASKYIAVPYSTDFAVMFLPVESLYAEVLKRPGLAEDIQNTYRVVISGPATFSALLSSLQMGFRTLAVEKRSAEIRRLLGQVKNEFVRFGDTIDKARMKLQQAAGELDHVDVRTRAITRKLNDAEEDGDAPLPHDE